MSNHRKSGNDYIKEYNKHISKAESIRIDMVKRLNQLIKIYPQAPVGDDKIASDIGYDENSNKLGRNMIEFYVINNMPASLLAKYIIKIEQYAVEQSGYVQTKLFD